MHMELKRIGYCFGIEVLLCVMFIGQATARQSVAEAYAEGQMTDVEYLVARAYEVYAPELFQQQFPHLDVSRHGKCNTLIAAGLQQNWNILPGDVQLALQQYLVRPNLPLDYISPGGGFRIHYTTTGTDAVSTDDEDNDGVPDYVEAAAEAADRALQVFQNLQYRDLPSDNGADGPEYDIFLVDMARQNLYGQTFFPPNIYTEIDKAFTSSIYYTQGIPGLQVTLAHELHHAVQFAYTPTISSRNIWWYEFTSTFMEDQVFDSINDYFQYLSDVFSDYTQPFNMQNGFHEYGMGIFNHFQTKKHGVDIVRRIWEIMAEGNSPLNAIDLAWQEEGGTFGEAVAEFYAWNYFTGTRADTMHFYPEGMHYPELALDHRMTALVDSATVTDTLRALAPEYHIIQDLIPARYAFAILDNQNIITTAVVHLSSPNTPEISFLRDMEIGPDALSVQNFGIGSRLIVVPAFTAKNAFGSTYINVDMKVSDVEQYASNTLIQNYPNPFLLNDHTETIFPYAAIEEGSAILFVTTAAGRVVKEFASRPVRTGFVNYTDFIWDGRDDDGALVPSGVYIYILKLNDYVGMKKFVVVR